MHRVLRIPELLDTIFRSLENHDNLNNALVCRSWSEVALDALWRHVDDLHRLFGLLAPLVVGKETKKWEFSRLPDSSDWKRFQKYTKRVREFSYNEDAYEVEIHQSVFDDVARTRTTLSILPNVHTLTWRAYPPLCVMFMHSNVRRFAIHLPELVKNSSLRPFFDDIISRMPRLTHFDIRTNIPVNVLERDIIHLLSSLLNLQKLTTPRFFFTSRIANCLSQLPKLGCIEFQYFEEQGTGDPNDIAIFRPELDEGAFPLLWDLSVAASYPHVERFLTIPFAPSNLTMLYVESPTFEYPTAIHQLLTAISENCQMLKLLALISPRQDPGNLADVSDISHRVDINTLKPVFACGNLTSLEVVHQFPLKLSQKDLEILALRWPSLETLNLNTEPHNFLTSELTLEALFPFAQHCPRLTYLGLFIDASSPSSIPPFNPTSPPYPSFKRLRRISLGLSPISSPTSPTSPSPPSLTSPTTTISPNSPTTSSTPSQPPTPTSIATFLSHLLPPTCKLDSGISWDESYELSRESNILIHQRFELWETVNALYVNVIYQDYDWVLFLGLPSSYSNLYGLFHMYNITLTLTVLCVYVLSVEFDNGGGVLKSDETEVVPPQFENIKSVL
ncbi:hypothetical protein AN958_01453 [Leucoagaricus sp. SymC.cos]|nr:hypothetical protein AN958_01453 [Leucoagaricus sp. SymC.cos]